MLIQNKQKKNNEKLTLCIVFAEDPQLPRPTPCVPSPCGANAICRETNGVGACTCKEDYIGNPYGGCRPECVVNSDCTANRACLGSKCQDPCPGTCGSNAICQVVNHVATCYCQPGYYGNPFVYCNVASEPGEYQNYREKKTKKIDQLLSNFHFFSASNSAREKKSLRTIALRTQQSMPRIQQPGRLLLRSEFRRYSTLLSSRMYSQFRVSLESGLCQ